MNRNVGTLDRALRVIVGVALIAFALAGPETGYTWLGWIGVVPIVTALAGWCPAYRLLGLRTCSVPKQA